MINKKEIEAENILIFVSVSFCFLKFFYLNELAYMEKRRTKMKKQQRGSTKNERKKTTWSARGRLIVTINLILFILFYVFVFVFETINRYEIKKDVEDKMQYISEGDLSWTTLSTVTVSRELQNRISKRAEEANDGLFELFIANNDVSFTVGAVASGECYVKFKCVGYSFDDFVEYCLNNNLNTQDELRDGFDSFTKAVEKTYCSQFYMRYVKNGGRWVCDYNTPEFLNNMSCGIVQAYEDYYADSIQAIQEFMEAIEQAEQAEEDNSEKE